jgi:prepilin signal peptidase PulO-like enzyme (type II secretory pathway)
MFAIGAGLYKQERIGGGDVKLMAMCGAFLGAWAIPAFLLSRFFVGLYRSWRKERGVLPYAPFLGIASIPFLWL